MTARLPEPRGVPKLPGLPAPAKQRGAGLGVALGLAAAGLTAAAGFAADRLHRDRRLALALDESITIDPFHDDPDEEHTVLADDGVALHVEVDHPRVVLTDGTEVLGEAAGDPGAEEPVRPTVVISHGYCLSLRSWVFQRRALRDAGYRVVLWDQRGHGRSGTGGRESYDIDQLGSDLARVIEEVVPTGPMMLVGHSMGGMTMMALALQRPDLIEHRVVGAAFIATSPGNLGGTTYGIPLLGRLVNRLAPPTTLLLSGRQGLVDGTIKAGREVVDLLVDWGSFASPVPMSIAQLTTDMIFGTRMDVISAFMPRFEAMDKVAALARFDGIESLVLSGMQDRLTPPEHSEQIVRHLPGAEHVLVADAGHVIMLEHPELLSEQLLALAERATRSAQVRGLDAGDGARPAGPGAAVRRTVTDLASAQRARRARARSGEPRAGTTRREKAPGEKAAGEKAAGEKAAAQKAPDEKPPAQTSRAQKPGVRTARVPKARAETSGAGPDKQPTKGRKRR